MANSALSLSGIDAFYGDSHVLQKVSFQLGEGRLLGLLGRNGAGKSTCMNVSVGLLPPRGGAVEVFGAAVTRLPPELIARRGVALVPQGRRVFKSLTVRENLMVAAHKGFAGRSHAPWTEATVFAMFPRLAERRGQMAGYLSGGEQQMLAIGRALTLNPRVLLLDEPTEGLAPIIVEELLRALGTITRAGGTCSIIVEQNAQKILGLADRVVILERGVIVHDAASAALKADPAVLERFLGVSGAAAH